MATSPASSTSVIDKDDAYLPHGTAKSNDNLNAIDPAHTQTQAAVLPDVEQEPQGDLEKGTSAKPHPPPGAFDPRQNPDGGRDAWLCVLGGFCVLFCSFGWINCIVSFSECKGLVRMLLTRMIRAFFKITTKPIS